MIEKQEIKQRMVEVQKLCKRSVLEVCAVDKKAIQPLLILRNDLKKYLQRDPKDIDALRSMYYINCYLLNFCEALTFLERVCNYSDNKKDKVDLIQLREIATSMKILTLKPYELAALKSYLEESLYNTPCDHTLKQTSKWLEENTDKKYHASIKKGLQNSGGYCDCEIVYNVTDL